MNISKGLIIGGIFALGIFVGAIVSLSFSKGKGENKILSTAQVLTTTPLVNQGQDIAKEELSSLKVTKVIDGDTVVLDSDETVRLIGIDAPEKNDCFAQESTQELQRLIDGKEVRQEKDISETDRYQRLLRYIWSNQTLINDELVRQGFAKAYPYAPDLAYRNQFAQAEQEAKENNRGLWGECDNQGSADKQQDSSTGKSTNLANVEDRDCRDFKTHAEAQTFFESAGPGDPHRLDSDGDGIACESLP